MSCLSQQVNRTQCTRSSIPHWIPLNNWTVHRCFQSFTVFVWKGVSQLCLIGHNEALTTTLMKKKQNKNTTTRIFSSFSEVFPVIPNFFSPYVCKIEERLFYFSESLQKAFRLGVRPTGKPEKGVELLQTYFSSLSPSSLVKIIWEIIQEITRSGVTEPLLWNYSWADLSSQLEASLCWKVKMELQGSAVVWTWTLHFLASRGLESTPCALKGVFPASSSVW